MIGSAGFFHVHVVNVIFIEVFFSAIFVLPVFFRTSLPCSGGYHLERGGMPLHDAVGVNCKKGTTTENQGAGIKYMD